MDWQEMRKQVLAGTYRPLPKGWKVRDPKAKRFKPVNQSPEQKKRMQRECRNRIIDLSDPLFP